MNVILLQLQVITLIKKSIYIYIYKQRPYKGKHKILSSGTFYTKIIEISSSVTLEIKTN